MAETICNTMNLLDLPGDVKMGRKYHFDSMVKFLCKLYVYVLKVFLNLSGGWLAFFHT